MEARYLTDKSGNRVGILLEDEMEDIRRYDEAIARRERGEDDSMPWEQAKREIEQEREELGRRGEL